MAEDSGKVSSDALERNKAVVRAALEAADRGDINSVRACFSPDYVDHSPTIGSRYAPDREGAMRAFGELASAFGGLRHSILDLIAEGDKVVLRVAATASHNEDFRGIPPTGEPLSLTQTAIYRLEDGKIVERWVDGVESVVERLQTGRPRTEFARPAHAGGVQVLRADSAHWHADASGGEYWELRLGGVSLTCFRLEPGIAFPSHAHTAEQITLVLEGHLSFDLEDNHVTLGPGDAIAVPSGLAHAVSAGSDPVLAVDAWSPPPQHLGSSAGR